VCFKCSFSLCFSKFFLLFVFFSNAASALHWAVIRGLPFLIAPLLQRGADLTLRDKSGKTPQELADANGHLRCVLELQTAPVAVTPAEKEARRQRLWYMGFCGPSILFALGNVTDHPFCESFLPFGGCFCLLNCQQWGAASIVLLAVALVYTGWLQRNILGAVRRKMGGGGEEVPDVFVFFI
jgi:hypothetical protein